MASERGTRVYHDLLHIRELWSVGAPLTAQHVADIKRAAETLQIGDEIEAERMTNDLMLRMPLDPPNRGAPAPGLNEFKAALAALASTYGVGNG